MFHNDRWTRQIHNFPNGNYTVGRHSVKENIDLKSINEPFDITKTSHIQNLIFPGFIGCLTYYPWNNQFIKRKLQQKYKMNPNNKNGAGHHLFWSVEQMVNVRNKIIETSYHISKFPTLIFALNNHKQYNT